MKEIPDPFKKKDFNSKALFWWWIKAKRRGSSLPISVLVSLAASEGGAPSASPPSTTSCDLFLSDPCCPLKETEHRLHAERTSGLFRWLTKRPRRDFIVYNWHTTKQIFCSFWNQTVTFVHSGDIVQLSKASGQGSVPDVPHEVHKVSEEGGPHCGLHGTNGEPAATKTCVCW